MGHLRAPYNKLEHVEGHDVHVLSITALRAFNPISQGIALTVTVLTGHFPSGAESPRSRS